MTYTKEHWLNKIAESSWDAGKFLYELLSKGTFFDAVGDHSRVLLLVEGDELISYCTYAQYDDIQPTNLTPWVGFVYTFPQYRGHHYIRYLFQEIERIARSEHVENIYISTNHVGLYEKYGFEFRSIMQDIDGNDSKVYIKKIKD